MPKDDRPDHDDDYQAGSNWMTYELQIGEEASVVYLTGERWKK